ncbi:hypothetical protein DITRI_Ditri13aG0166300 [Diplodiscus trichospermus]
MNHGCASFFSYRDDCVGRAVSVVQIGACHDQVCPIFAVDNKVSSNSFESENKNADPSSIVEPVMPTQPYTIPVQSGTVQASTDASGQPQTHPNASLIPPQMVPKEAAALPQSASGLTSQQYPKLQAGHPLVNVSQTEAETRLAGAQIQHQPQSFGVAAAETANYTKKLNNDSACIDPNIQISASTTNVAFTVTDHDQIKLQHYFCLRL